MDDFKYDYDPVVLNKQSTSGNQQDYRMQQGQKWRQYIVAGVANLGMLALGYCLGWTSPVEAKLLDLTQSPLDVVVTADELAWIGSILTLGAIFGPFLGGASASRIGRKYGALAASIPLLIGWIFIALAKNVAMIYAGRFFWGLAVGMLFTITPMYVGEIASDDVRGALGSFMLVFVVIGYLIITSLGPFVSYSIVSYAGVALVILFDVLFFFMPESPSYYLTKDNPEAAGKSLATIRGLPKTHIKGDLANLQASIQAATAETAKVSDLWATRGNIKALYISCALVAFQQLCGINAVMFYLGRIFYAAGSGLDSSIATIIIGVVQLCASCITPLVVDKLGRRPLLLVSSAGMTFGLGLLGMYFILDDYEHPAVSSLGFLPVLSLVVFIVAYCFGFGPLPWAVIGELFPINIKAVATPLATAFCWILAFIVTRFFGNIVEAIGMHYAFWIFGVWCIIAFFFTLFLVPETKCKSQDEIQDLLNGRKPQNMEYTSLCRKPTKS